MEQSFVDENVGIGNNEIIEICMDDEIMEENLNVQIKIDNQNPKNEKEKQTKINLKKLHAQKNNQQPHGILSLCWKFYYVNDNTKIDLEYI